MKLENRLFYSNSMLENNTLITDFSFSFNLKRNDFDKLILNIEKTEDKIFSLYYLGIDKTIREYEINSYTSFVRPKGKFPHYQFKAQFIAGMSFVITAGRFLENVNNYSEYKLNNFLFNIYFPEMFNTNLGNLNLNSKEMNLIIN